MRGEGRHFALQVGRNVLAFLGQFEQRVEVAGEAGDFLVLGDLLFQALAVLHDLLAFFGRIPEIGSVDLVVGFG